MDRAYIEEALGWALRHVRRGELDLARWGAACALASIEDARRESTGAETGGSLGAPEAKMGGVELEDTARAWSARLGVPLVEPTFTEAETEPYGYRPSRRWGERYMSAIPRDTRTCPAHPDRPVVSLSAGCCAECQIARDRERWDRGRGRVEHGSTTWEE